MTKAYILLVIGIWTAVLPLLGFPSSWKGILFTLTGLGIIYFSYVFYMEAKKKQTKPKVFDNFSEREPSA